ncbi:MAG TPA: response regulator transcription factor [Acidimicrobiia bacterium]|nr:response regulator transcription factor [Acidimicrobiia bacterium]
MTRVIIVDDAPLFSAGMSAALENAGFKVVGSAENALAGVEVAREHQPDLVILDVLMPGISGLEVVDKLKEAAPATKVVLLTASESEEDLLKAIKAGSVGYITKTTPLPQLVTAMQDVAAGGAVVSPAMGMKLFETVAQMLRHRDVIVGRKPALTGREIEVLQAVARGRTSREIGEMLFISENTVKNHVRNILDKLGLHSRGEAVMYALREDLIRID